MGDYVETHAVLLKEPCPQHIATAWDGDGEKHLYRCALELARLVGICTVANRGFQHRHSR